MSISKEKVIEAIILLKKYQGKHSLYKQSHHEEINQAIGILEDEVNLSEQKKTNKKR